MIGVAGAVAEFCWVGEWGIETIENGCWHDPDVMSDSDWNIAGCPPGHPTRGLLGAVEGAFGLLNRDTGALFPQLTWEARRLISESRIIASTERV
jgi:hypothetical protein